MADQRIPQCPDPDYDGDDALAFRQHVIADLHNVQTTLAALVAELEVYRPLLAMFRPRNGQPGGVSDMTKAGIARALRRAGRDAQS